VSFAETIVSQRRLMLAIAAILTLAGLGSWMTVARQEDPILPYRGALLIVPFPGADALTVERLVVDPIEEELAEVVEIADIESTSRTGVAIIKVFLQESIYDVDAVYDEVDRHLRELRPELPDSILEPIFNREVWDQESVVYAVTGSDDRHQLDDAAERLRRRLIELPNVSRIINTADPGEEVRVEIDEVAARAVGIDVRMLAGLLQSRNAVIPGGTAVVDGRTVALTPLSDFGSIDELAATPIPLPSGSAIQLSEIATIRLTTADPVASRMRLNGETAVGVGIVPRPGINIVAFGEDVRRVAAEVSAEIAPLRVEEVAFQPDVVESRLSSLQTSLLQSILVVALVLVVFMGPRLGLTVAAVVPIVTLVTLALWTMGGGVLHQMSIAALVLAMGMLVDNAIVVAEDVQQRIDEGADRWDAARASSRTLLVPLASATGTTVAAFVPMLLSGGATADFTRSIPAVVILTLVVSYVVAVAITPTMAALSLRPNARAAGARTSRWAEWVGAVAVRQPWLVLVAAVLLVAASVSAAPRLSVQFFPASDRAQFLVDITLPEGAHVDRTDQTAQVVEEALLDHESVAQVASFVGNGAPHFYYNVISRPAQPNLSQLIVTTTNLAGVETGINLVRDEIAALVPEAELVAKRIEQGPPVGAPIEIRLYGHDLGSLNEAAEQVVAVLRDTPGAVDVRHGMGIGSPAVEIAIDDANAARFGLARTDVALAVLGQTRGIPAGQFRAEEDPIDIVVRGREGERLPIDAIASIDVAPVGGVPIPLAAVARESVTWRPAAVEHRNRSRVVVVSAQLEHGYTFSSVLAAARPVLGALALPDGVRVEYGGDAEGSDEANSALLKTVPYGMMLLLAFLLAEFNSFRQVAIILVTVPLAATGVVPGLLLNDQPFGFMSMLGIVALVGIVVNNAIILLDVVGSRRAEGATVAEAVSSAVTRRIRPIFLTTGTTVLGLVPLAVSSSTLWPPLASALISGLLASTVLTLFVVPALYRLAYRDTKSAEPVAGA
jgi:multidrug efflux pump subunit AcrB